jgi:hypothetical protein
MGGNYFRVVDISGAERFLDLATRMKWRAAIVPVTYEQCGDCIAHGPSAVRSLSDRLFEFVESHSTVRRCP